MTVVVDTNVIVVANHRSNHASDDCILTAIEVLKNIRHNDRVALDDGMRIFDEYLRYGNLAGQPGLGDAFVKHIYENLGNDARCVLVAITPRDKDNFEEFPADALLDGFDRSDRKFVAVARALNPIPEIINATDRDWWDYRGILSRFGVEIQFLCPELMVRA